MLTKMLAAGSSVTSMRSALLLLAPVAAALLACSYRSDDDDHRYEPPPPFVAAIDPNGFMEVEPGTGAGVFVEYEPSGRWHVYTSCDYATSGARCDWSVLVTVAEGSRVSGFETEGLEPEDNMYWYDDTQGEFVTSTHDDFDGIYFTTDPGAPVRIDARLDGGEAYDLVMWIDRGAVVEGAPNNPIDLYPNP